MSETNEARPRRLRDVLRAYWLPTALPAFIPIDGAGDTEDGTVRRSKDLIRTHNQQSVAPWLRTYTRRWFWLGTVGLALFLFCNVQDVFFLDLAGFVVWICGWLMAICFFGIHRHLLTQKDEVETMDKGDATFAEHEKQKPSNRDWFD